MVTVHGNGMQLLYSQCVAGMDGVASVWFILTLHDYIRY